MHGRDGFLWLLDVHHALRQHEMRTENLARPGEHRIPGSLFPLDQAHWRFGAVEKQITAKILCDLICDRFGIFSHCVNHGVGEPRERHLPRVDEFRLRIPFRRDCGRECLCRRDKSAPSRSQDRFAIERYSDAVLHITRDRLLVESLSQARPKGLPRRFGRVERLVFENLGKNLTHWDEFVQRKITRNFVL